jgi:hypothetical protein
LETGAGAGAEEPIDSRRASIPSLKRSLPIIAAVAVAVVVGSALLISNQDDSPASSAPAASAPASSGVPAPAGDLPGWRQVFIDDFPVDVESWGDCGSYEEHTCPSLPEPYQSKWWAYPSSHQDTREKLSGDGGFYEPSNLSMSDGMLRIQLRRENGTTQAAAPYPRMRAQTYGRYAVRFKADPVPGFKIAWLLWRTSTSWGEIDFPEGDLDSEIVAFLHKESGQDEFSSGVELAGAWHTTVVEWTPGKVKFFLDDRLIGTSTDGVPSTPMDWILQSETALSGDLPEDGAVANIYIDWVAAWERS